MQIMLDSKDILKSVKELNIELDFERDVEVMKNELGKLVSNTLDRTCTYTIKNMPVPDAFKDILYDIKESFKTKDFKEIVKTIVNSSVREGLEIIGFDKEKIQNLKDITEIAKKGGLMQGVKAGIEMVAKKYLDNNLVGDFVYDFFNSIKIEPLNKTFGEKLNNSIENVLKNKEKFFNACNNFKEAYENFDIEKINILSKEIKNKFKVVNYDRECISKNKIIQNITMLVNSKKEKLTEAQLQLCNVL